MGDRGGGSVKWLRRRDNERVARVARRGVGEWRVAGGRLYQGLG